MVTDQANNCLMANCNRKAEYGFFCKTHRQSKWEPERDLTPKLFTAICIAILVAISISVWMPK